MTPNLALRINIAGLLVLSAALLGAFFVQFGMGEFPCPLCLLQRLGMLGVAFGAMLNIRYGIRPAHYGVSVLSAVFGASVSARQILLHIVPGEGPGGYGSTVLGMHLYSWAFVVFAVSIALIGVIMMFEGQFQKGNDADYPRKTPIITTVFFLVVLITLSNAITTFLECGFVQCPDDPVSYIELGKIKYGGFINLFALN